MTDFLFLRELAAIRDCLKSMRESGTTLDYEKIPFDDDKTFRLLQTGETIGTFQLESPAQRVLMQRLKPKTITDCVAAVALIRPGPIQGDAITPFVRRRNGQEPVTYPHERLKPVLKDTLGVVIYQDQVIELAMAAAGWGPDQADTLRRRISHARSKEQMRQIGGEFMASVVANGFTADVAAWCFKSILGFASYGFCAAHAAAFGETAYRSAYLLAHHPSHYLMGIMNNFPMAYYPLRTIVAEARRRGIKVLGPDVNRSGTDDRANDTTIRAGLKHIRGVKRKTLEAVEAARKDGPFRSVFDFCRRVPASHGEVESLALSGAFGGVCANRKAVLRASARLAAAGTQERQGGLLVRDHALPAVPDFPPYERALRELAVLGFCVGKDPVAFHRERLASAGIRTCREALEGKGSTVYVAGWRTRPHTPPIKSGKTIVFFTLEDETGILDVTMFPDVYDVYGHVTFAEPLVVVRGRMESRDGALGLIAESVRPLNEVVAQVRQLQEMLPSMEGVSMEASGWTMPAEAFAGSV
jgi:error-prone DNA polymerase